MSLNHKDWQSVRQLAGSPVATGPLPGLNRSAPRAYLVFFVLGLVPGLVFFLSGRYGHVRLFVGMAIVVAYWGVLVEAWPRRRPPHKHPTFMVGISWLSYLFSRHYITSHMRKHKAPSGWHPTSNT